MDGYARELIGKARLKKIGQYCTKFPPDVTGRTFQRVGAATGNVPIFVSTLNNQNKIIKGV